MTLRSEKRSRRHALALSMEVLTSGPRQLAFTHPTWTSFLVFAWSRSTSQIATLDARSLCDNSALPQRGYHRHVLQCSFSWRSQAIAIYLS